MMYECLAGWERNAYSSGWNAIMQVPNTRGMIQNDAFQRNICNRTTCSENRNAAIFYCSNVQKGNPFYHVYDIYPLPTSSTATGVRTLATRYACCAI